MYVFAPITFDGELHSPMFFRRFFWPWMAFFGLTWAAFLALCVARLAALSDKIPATQERNAEIREAFCCLAIAGA